MNRTFEYTPEETETLRAIFASPETIESQMHRLPGRSMTSIETKAHKLGLVKVRAVGAFRQIQLLMADGKPRTIREIESATGLRRKYIAEQFRMYANGIDFHIAGFEGGYRRHIFVAGPGENAVRPEPARLPQKGYAARRRAARPEKQEAPERVKVVRQKIEKPPKVHVPRPEYDAAWWPKADPVLSDAFAAMARIGRVAE